MIFNCDCGKVTVFPGMVSKDEIKKKVLKLEAQISVLNEMLEEDEGKDHEKVSEMIAKFESRRDKYEAIGDREIQPEKGETGTGSGNGRRKRVRKEEFAEEKAIKETAVQRLEEKASFPDGETETPVSKSEGEETVGEFVNVLTIEKKKRKYQKNIERDPEKIKNKLLEWVELHGGQDNLHLAYSGRSNPETKRKVSELWQFVGCSEAILLRRLGKELVSEGKLEKIKKSGSFNGLTFSYKIVTKEDKKLKRQAEKALQEEKKLQEKLNKHWAGLGIKENPDDLPDWEYKNEIEDDIPMVSDMTPPVRRIIKDPCPRCGGNLSRDNTETLSKDILNDNVEVLTCLLCGHEIYSEVKEAA